MKQRDLLPGEVLRILSSHGQVNAVLGGVGVRCDVAPFEDRVVLFIRPTSPAAKALLSDNTAELRATEADRSYNVQLKGRAVLGRNARLANRGGELTPWTPEGTALQGWLAVPFFAEEVEYYRGQERFHGKTSAAEVPGRAARWRWAGWSGAIPQLAIGLATIWGYLIYKGSDLPFRPVALVLAALVVLLSVAGAQCWLRAAQFARWRKGGRADADNLLNQGLLAPGTVQITGYVYSALGLLLLAPLNVWGTDVLGVAAIASMVWFQWPLNLSKVFTGDTDEEARER